jgi:hypothetical protein
MLHDNIWLKHTTTSANIHSWLECWEGPYDQGSDYTNCIKQTN